MPIHSIFVTLSYKYPLERETHVAYLIHQGVDPLLIKSRLGHVDIRMTLNTYGHLYPDEQEKVARMLDERR